MENNAPSQLTSPVWGSTSTGTSCWSSSTLFSSPSPSLLCHTSCCSFHHSHCLGPTLLTISALWSFLLLTMTQAVQLLHITATFNITVTAQVHLLNWMKDATQTLEHICLWEHRWLWDCVWDRERDRERETERETTLETKINNNIHTNYIQYTVGDPFIWQKTLRLYGRTDRQCW